MEVISTRRYEARPPGALGEPPSAASARAEASVATVKEEEWETRKKKEITRTRQIETRVKRQVVLEDGEVVVDSGPLVTTNTTEDVEQQEHTTQERRTTADEPRTLEWPVADLVHRELNRETVVRSHEETEERLETEDRRQLGDITDEAYQRAIRANRTDLRAALQESSKELAPQTGPRVLRHTTKSNKVVDTEDTLEKKELKADGLVVTETNKTVEHEEIRDDELPDDGRPDEDVEKETRKEGSQRFVKTRDEDVVDYVSGGEKIARETRFVSETTEGERAGNWPPTTTMKTTRLHKHGFPADAAAASRKDALTKKPLDLEEEDEARKFETSKWLECHFGSDSRSSHDSEAEEPPVQTGTNTSFINVTMKSCTPRDREYRGVAHFQRPQPRGSRDSASPSGYYHGISEWSERYQGVEKRNDQARSASPTFYVSEGPKSNGYLQENSRTQESSYSRGFESSRRSQERKPSPQEAPSPPLRRRPREQVTERQEKGAYESSGRTASPVHVVQRTWESRTRDARNEAVQREPHGYSPRKSPPRSRSASPLPPVSGRREKVSEDSGAPRASKSSGQSKYKIGESFRKLVGKLRSASSERRNKKASDGESSARVARTDREDGPTYLQYNVVDGNIPLGEERPPRSPTARVSASSKTVERVSQEQWTRTEGAAPPVHRYYLGEDPFGGSIYGREKGYGGMAKPSGKRTSGRSPAEPGTRVESSSLGRFSKSTGRLTAEHERDEFRTTRTLPRKLHSAVHPGSSRRSPNATSTGVGKSVPSVPAGSSVPSGQFGSMINISIKNTVTSPVASKPGTSARCPEKPERAYKSSIARSKSFNVEASRSGPEEAPRKSTSQLNRLDETPPLKSPGILASISRSNRDLFKASKYEY
ncbi:serine/arginine repetitive matrix protein 1 isoform X2 [Orussus abietinus]|uniref:serine/arginine repetitive matrix protein 1 isoform X2 n=1 Tax=Orussus abietinus TaxID=222816 RepID=UPI00062595C1|nr:serine/arginine repetitive matrix protein 1 isoform X2 [Orussus abietinus]